MPTIVFDEAGDADSRALIAAFQNSGYFDVAALCALAEEMNDAIDAGQGQGGAAHPAGLWRPGAARPDRPGATDRGWLRPERGLHRVVCGGAVAQAQIGRRCTSATLARHGRGGVSGGIDLRPVVLYNPSMLSANFMVPGIIGLILHFQTLLLTSFAVVRERERGTLEQSIVTPIRPWELMLGKIVPYTVTASVSAAVAMVAGRVLFGVEVAGSLGPADGLSVLFLLGSLGLGLAHLDLCADASAGDADGHVYHAAVDHASPAFCTRATTCRLSSRNLACSFR